MQLLEGKAKNFLSFREFQYSYSAQGLTNIDGHDDDLDVNTGAGKSAFMDLPCYAFFGKTSKDLKADEVINWDVKKDLEVQFSFRKPDGIYEIFRYRKHKDHDNDFYILDPSGQKIRGKDARETQKLLDGILGFNYEIFKKAIYFGQFDDTDKFLSSSDKEKKDLISTICDLSAYDEKLDLVKAEMKEDNVQLSDLNIKRGILNATSETLDRQVVSMNQSVNSWKESQDSKLLLLNQDLKNWGTQHGERGKQLDSDSSVWFKNHQSDIHIIQINIDNFETEKSTQVTDLQEECQKWQDNQESLVRVYSSDVGKLESDTNEAKQAYESEASKDEEDLSVPMQKIQSNINNLKQIEKEAERLGYEKDSLGRDNQKLKQQIADEKNKMAKSIGSTCSFCHQEITGKEIEANIEVLMVEGKKRRESIDVIQIQVQEKRKQCEGIASLESDLRDLSEKKSQQTMRAMNIRTLKDKFEGLERSWKDKLNSIETEKGRGNPHNRSVEMAKNKPNPYTAQLESESKIENPHLDKIDLHKKEINPFPERILQAVQEENPYNTKAIDIFKELEKSKEQLKERDLDIIKVEHRLRLGEYWKSALGVYIKSMLMDSFLEQLNIQANEYLETLFGGVLKIQLSSVTEGKKGVKEKIDQKIFNGNHECSYNNLSGGERSRVCLAVNLALSDITCNSLGTSFSLLMLDEVFNGLDSAGKEQTMKLLKELEPRFETILVIDHTEEFKSLFSNTITVKKKGGVSYIV